MNLKRVVGLVLVLWSVVAQAADFEDCTASAWVTRAGLIEATLANRTCIGVGEDSQGDARMRVVTMKDDVSAGASGWSADVLTAAKKALGDYRAADSALVFRNVTFALTPHDDPVDHAIATTNLATGTECLVVVRTESTLINTPARRANLLANTVAHELVHCLQQWNVPAQMEVDRGTRQWWVEGWAEYLGNVVYPTASELKEAGALFAEDQRPITQQKYGMAVFFAFFAQLKGTTPLSFWKAMPTTSGEAAQRAALLGQISLDELQRFAKDWVDHLVTMPNGYAFDPGFIEPMTFLSGGMNTAEAVPFEVMRRELVFKDAEYELTSNATATPAPSFKLPATFTVDRGWSTMVPGKGGSWCGDDGPHYLLTGITTSEPQKVTVTATKTEMPASPDCKNVCMPKEQTDSCLVGEWVLDDVAVEKRVDEIFDGKTNPHAVVNGTTTLRLGPDGTNASMSYDDYDIFVGAQGQNGDPDVFYEFTITGAIKGQWSTGADHSFQICPTENTSSILTQVQIFDGVSNPKSSTTDKGDALANLAYSCVGASLELRAVGITNEKGSPITWVFHRKPGTGIAGVNACSITPASLIALGVLGLLFRRRRNRV